MTHKFTKKGLHHRHFHLNFASFFWTPISQSIYKHNCFWNLKKIRDFAKFSEKHLWWSLLFNNVAGWRPVTLLKKSPAQFFRLNFEKFFLKNTYFVKYLQTAASEIWSQLRQIWSECETNLKWIRSEFEMSLK